MKDESASAGCSESLTNTNGLDRHGLEAMVVELRKGVYEVCDAVNNGHIGGSSSSVELMASLYFGGFLKYDPNNLEDPDRDRVLVRGHLGPLRYKIFGMLGHVSDDELGTYRQLGSRLQGHEEWQEMSGVDLTPSGSLGMLLSYGTGAAIVAKDQGRDFKTYVFLGDGEEQEGNISEAARHAANLALDNLVVIVDANTKQLSGPVSAHSKNEDLATIWRGYGWDVLEIENGHDLDQITGAYSMVQGQQKPLMIIAHTIKGQGLEGAEDHFCGYHTIRTCPKPVVRAGIEQQQQMLDETGHTTESLKEMVAASIKANINRSSYSGAGLVPFRVDVQPSMTVDPNLENSLGEYFRGVRQAVETTNMTPLYFLTADVTLKDYVDREGLREFAKYYDVGIREQHMISMAHGISLTDRSARIIVNALDAFVYRPLDQLNSMIHGEGRVVNISNAAGITNDKNGKTHQSSGQPGSLTTLPGMTFLEPGDVQDLYSCLNWALSEAGEPVLVRVSKAPSRVLEAVAGDIKNIGSYIVYEPKVDHNLTIIASGITAGQSVGAAEMLEIEGIGARVINVVNSKTLQEDFTEKMIPERPALTVYNGHNVILQNQVASAVLEFGSTRPSRLVGHGFSLGTSGRYEDLLRHYKLDAEGIMQVVKERVLVTK
jgi:transketolase